MTDSVQVFDPGFRVLDSNGNPVNNAKIKFREVGPGAVKTVYSDYGLSVSLGDTVRTRADGYPVVTAGSNTTTLIYVGSAPYYVEITDEFDVAIFPAKDNVRGAVDTSTFLTLSATSILVIPVVAKSANYTATLADKGKLIAANASGGFFTITLPSAVTAGDGWNIGIRNDGTSNLVGVAASQNIATSMGAVTAFSLRIGETIWLESNGATFKQSGYTPPLISGTVGLILIADRLSTPPGSPVAGDRYMVGAAPAGAWAAFAQHDIAEANGQGGWLKTTPPADGGWLAYVQDEDIYYSFVASAWLPFLGPITALTTEPVIDGVADFFPFYDTSAAAVRKGLPQNLKQAGGFQLLNSGAVSAAATLDIVLTAYTAYRALKLVLSSFVPATDDVELWMRFSTDGGSAYDATGYSYSLATAADDTGTVTGMNAAAANQILAAGHTSATVAVSNVANEGGVDAEISLHDLPAVRFGRARIESAYYSASGVGIAQYGGGIRENAQDTDAVRFLFESGNITSGKWALYGLI